MEPRAHGDTIEKHLPLCAPNATGSHFVATNCENDRQNANCTGGK
jgi:hypothetical protein